MPTVTTKIRTGLVCDADPDPDTDGGITTSTISDEESGRGNPEKNDISSVVSICSHKEGRE